MDLYIFLFSVITIFDCSVIGVQTACKLPLDMGTSSCKDGNKEIRYHFDENSNIPLAFEYTGCGGNENNFKSEWECRKTCFGPIDYTGCAAGTKPLKVRCESDSECGPKGICKNQHPINICCDKEIDEKYHADWNPKCPKGRKVLKIELDGVPHTVAGKTCKSKFCPAGATCVEGTYFATCCK